MNVWLKAGTVHPTVENMARIITIDGDDIIVRGNGNNKIVAIKPEDILGFEIPGEPGTNNEVTIYFSGHKDFLKGLPKLGDVRAIHITLKTGEFGIAIVDSSNGTSTKYLRRGNEWEIEF